MSDQRPTRGCDVCGGVDTDPRHVLAVPSDFPGAVPAADLIRTSIANGASDEAIAALMDPETVVRHMDCCAERGCPTGDCDAVLADAGNKRGASLVRHLTKEA